MVSPLFVAFPRSQWRSHVEATWRYLELGYEITEDADCSTHVHISVEGGYSLEELKRIAQCVIHFEPAFEALVPPQRRGGECASAKSIWLDSDHLAYQNRSRDASIRFIETLTDFYTFSTVMNPDRDRTYGWNFRSIEKYYTVEFRKPPGSTTADQVLGWAELAMSFVQASLRLGSIEKLRKVPSTVGGLLWFIQQSRVPGMNEHNRLYQFWQGISMRQFEEPGTNRPVLAQEDLAMLVQLRDLSVARISIDSSVMRPPYWQ